ncbi:hypothetical protein SEA_SOILDRAGON_6 [Mycobacterium phage SoilDragon]|uniref:Uncharacterized protein n=1 Tax=Mycobacterium phage SoilDragon TaxID=2590944 RepID=A0A516KUE0_9CAUD|nr:hypothetical protein M611_gp06 [Mycobacterium phage Jobu08]YP_010060050.1 hypothetical protein KIJ58_gp06 [Mycobacterium phage SoilDragon]AGM61528.1 hypothetical protein PBI_JOBU08_6 [Mycobacterium phage Jobu08]QDP45309.1 hypothetical protein SEA_SOILDRAGON_6 [Mycobacterium phage SoilDragon]
MNPDDLYTFAIYYEAQAEPEGPWVEMVAIQQNLAQAQEVYDVHVPLLADMPNVRNAAIVHTPKIAWIPWTE